MTRRKSEGLAAFLAAIAVCTVSPSVLGQPCSQPGVVSAARAPYPNFESGPTQPLLLAPARDFLYVLNTPDHRLERYSLPGINYAGSIFTGLEPVAMVLDPNDSNVMYVANYVSDSVAVLDLGALDVTDVIAVGDEPYDLAIVQGNLYVACARTVQPSPPTNTQSHLLVKVDLSAMTTTNFEIDAHKPRAIELVGDTLFIVSQNSGNDSTILTLAEMKALGYEQLDLLNGEAAFDFNPVLTSPGLIDLFPGPGTGGWSIPLTGRVVEDVFRNGEVAPWVPSTASLPSYLLRPEQYTVLNRDVIAFDTTTDQEVRVTNDVGTTLFNVRARPGTNELWIPLTDADNMTRFEPVLAGAAVANRVSLVDATNGSIVGAIDLTGIVAPMTAYVNAAGVYADVNQAQPIDVAFYSGTVGGQPVEYAFVACLGTHSVLVLDAASHALVDVVLTDLMPMGLVVDEPGDMLYVYSRGSHQVEAFEIDNGYASTVRPLAYDPEPTIVRDGRRHLYDASTASGHGNGTMACAACHVFGDEDGLAWDLGDPEGGISYGFPDIMTGILGAQGAVVANPFENVFATHPMKGPMTTQSLRGLEDDEPFHWRGDRRTFQNFRGAFAALLGGSGITGVEMQEYTEFVKSIRYSPNPFQEESRTYHDGGTMEPQALTGIGKFGMPGLFAGESYLPVIVAPLLCVDCHHADFAGGTDFTGSQTTINWDGHAQLFNTPQLRQLYEKDDRELTGFGTDHEGGQDGIRGFLDTIKLDGVDDFVEFDPAERDAVGDFVRAWDTGMSPLVGRQMHVNATNATAMMTSVRLADWEARAQAGEIDLIVRGTVVVSGLPTFPHGAVWREVVLGGTPSMRYDSDIGPGFAVTRGELLSLIDTSIEMLVFTCVPPGTGERLAIDRDEDGLRDWEEILAGYSWVDPDTDNDGYSDAIEHLDPNASGTSCASIPNDVDDPIIEVHEARNTFITTSTMHVITNEPTTLSIDVTLPDTTTRNYTSSQLKCRHDVVMDMLPPNSTLPYSIVATDAASRTGSDTSTTSEHIQTMVMHLHVEDLDLTAVPLTSGDVDLQATMLVKDQDGNAMPGGIRVYVLFHSTDVPSGVDVLGSTMGTPNPVLAAPLTDATGTATFNLTFTPGTTAPYTLAVSPLFIGTISPTDPPAQTHTFADGVVVTTNWFVGTGGAGSPGQARDYEHFYDVNANAQSNPTSSRRKHYATVQIN